MDVMVTEVHCYWTDSPTGRGWIGAWKVHNGPRRVVPLGPQLDDDEPEAHRDDLHRAAKAEGRWHGIKGHISVVIHDPKTSFATDS